MIITIDGPAGTGKSTLARELATRLDFAFLDTGAMYRAIAWNTLRLQIPFDDQMRISEMADNCTIELDPYEVWIDGHEISDLIRTPEVAQASSLIAQIPGVRHSLVAQQRNFALERHVVTEGRDQGTVVFPHANRKFFLTARSEVRAQRRYQEMIDKGLSANFEQILNDQCLRDEQDRTRAHSPLVKAQDAIEIDTSDLNFEAVLEILRSYIPEPSES